MIRHHSSEVNPDRYSLAKDHQTLPQSQLRERYNKSETIPPSRGGPAIIPHQEEWRLDGWQAGNYASPDFHQGPR